MQFGAGNFLRAFVDVFVDRANALGQGVGRVLVVQSTPGARAAQLNAQGGRYHVLTRGIEKGQEVDRVDEVASISRALVAAEQWEEVLAAARSPELRFVVSNTTEAGLVLEEKEPPLGAGVPWSFPAKLLDVLRARFEAGLAGLAILPCELVEENGQVLRGLVLEQARRWGLDAETARWVGEECRWCDTLVDRIVSGRPAEHPLLASDPLLTVAEPYALWAIAAPGGLDFCEDAAIRVVDDVTPYALRKVRLLNGAHTALVCRALPEGKVMVRQALEDEKTRAWLERLLFEELLPPVEDRVEGGRAFAGAVLERFANPFLEHKLQDIALHHDTKVQTRLLPTYNEYLQTQGRQPPLLTEILQPHL